MAVEADIRLRGHAGFGCPDRRTLGDVDLRLDDVDARHLLRDGVLDLDARIDLDEVELAGIGIHQELDRAGAVIVGGVADLEAVVGQFLALGIREIGRRRALHDLLVAALHRAVTLEEMDDIAVPVAEDLHLDMAGALDELLEIDLVLAEGGLGLAARRHGVLEQRFLVADDAHAAAAAAPGGFQHHRIADALRLGLDELDIVRQRIGGRHDRHAGGYGEIARRDLVAEHAHRVGRGADEGNAGLGAGLGEFRALGEKAVAGMDGVGLRLAGDADDVGDVQIGLDRAEALADLIGLVGLEAVQRELVLLGEDRDRAQPQFIGGAEHADGDFRPVSDENLLDCHQNPRFRSTRHGGRPARC